MKKESKLGVGIALGCGIGAAIGVVTGNLGVCIGVGIAYLLKSLHILYLLT